MATFSSVTAGVSPIQSVNLNQFADALNGNGNYTVSLVGSNDPVNYALSVRNLDGTNGRSFRALDSSGSVRLSVDVNGPRADPDGAGLATLVTLSAVQALTNKTFVTPVFTSPAISSGSIADADILRGTISSATITGGTFGGTVSSATVVHGTISSATIVASTLTNNAIAGGTISSAAISLGTISSAAITGGTMQAAAVVGGTISSAILRDVTLSTAALSSCSWVGGTISSAVVQGGTLSGSTLSNVTLAGTLGGPAWSTFSPTVTQGGALTRNVDWGDYLKLGRQVTVNVHLTFTSSGSAGSDLVVGGLPVPALHADGYGAFGTWTFRDHNANLTYAGTVGFPSSVSALLHLPSTAGVASAFGTTPNVGVESSDSLALTLVYQSS